MQTSECFIVNLPRLHYLEAAFIIVLVIRQSRKCSANTGVDVRVVGKETFISSMPEVGTVINSGLISGCTTEDRGFPGVAVVL